MRKYQVSLLLGISLLLNIGLAFGLVRSGGGAEGGAGVLAGFGSPPGTDAPEHVARASGLDALTGAVAGSGIASADAAAALLALENRLYAEARQAVLEYWRTDPSYEIRYLRVRFDANDRIRAELLDQFGEAARREPVFRHLFRPLDPGFPFLSSAQQVAIERLRFERDLALNPAGRNGQAPVVAGGLAAGAAVSTAEAAAQRYRDGLAAILTADQLLEYELRDSSLARQLRGSGIGFTEDTFRAAFRILTGLGQRPADAAAVLAAREALRAVLGDADYARFWSRRDPAYERIAVVSAGLGLRQEQVDAVHAVIARNQDRLMEIAVRAADDPGLAARESQRLADQERADITRLVGEAAAAAILEARAVGSFRLQRGTTEPTGEPMGEPTGEPAGR